MTLEEKETESGQKLRGCVVRWTVAEAGGRQIEADKAKPSAKTSFAKKAGKWALPSSVVKRLLARGSLLCCVMPIISEPPMMSDAWKLVA